MRMKQCSREGPASLSRGGWSRKVEMDGKEKADSESEGEKLRELAEK